MNPKIFGAFLAGLVVASGITYYLVKPPEPAPAKTAQQTAVQAPAPAEATPAPPPVTSEPPVVDSSLKTAPEPAPAKPSPTIRTTTTAKRPVQTAQSSGHQNSHPAPPSTQHQTSAPASAPAPVQTASNTPPTPAPASSSHHAEETREPEPRPYTPPKIDIPPPPNKVTIPAGTLLTVRLGEKLSTEKNQPGDQFSAVLDQPLVIDGFVLAERGSKAQGRIVELDRGGKVKGLAQIALELTSVRTADGQNIKVNTASFKKQAEADTKRDAAKVGIGAAIGAAIGAIAGGGKGAAVGAGVGGAAGAGDVMLTRGKAAEIPVETRMSFRLSEPVVVTEKTR